MDSQMKLEDDDGDLDIDEVPDEVIDTVYAKIGASRLSCDFGYATPMGVIRRCDAAKAQELLKLLPVAQRKLAQAHADRLRDAMRSGRYVRGAGSLVCFSREAALMDGHHRLCAIVASQFVLDLYVCVVPDRAMAVIDTTNRPRTVRDIVAVSSEGKTHLANTVIAALVWDQVDCNISQWDKLQKSERAQIALEHPYRDRIAALNRMTGRTRPTAGVLIGAIKCMRECGDVERAQSFFQAALTNTHVVDGRESSGARALANLVFQGRSIRLRTRTDVAIKNDRDSAINAWNAHVTGREVKQLKGTFNGTSPKVARWNAQGGIFGLHAT